MINEMEFSTYHEVIASGLRDAIRRYFDIWEEVLDKPENEQPLWTSTIEQRRLSVVILSCTLLEAVINFYLCTKCPAKHFKDIESDKKLGSLFGKWTEAPKEFIKSYYLPIPLKDDLRSLINRRKAIIHGKPKMSIDGDNRHKGNEPLVAFDEHEFIGRCATLTFRLTDHLLASDSGAFIEMSSIRICCGTAGGEFNSGERRLEIASQHPRELIREIMQQGFDRRTAVTCAILIGDKPKTDAEGNIVVRHGKIITLKPLKFFSAKPSANVTKAN